MKCITFFKNDWIVALSLCAVAVLSAQPQAKADPLFARIDAYIVTTAPDGRRVLELAEVAQPEDIILYRATFENDAEVALDSVKPVVPIPVGLEYVVDTVNPKPAQVSLDGKTFQSFPASDAIGTPVDPSSYRAFRWELDSLKADAAFTVELQAKLITQQ